MCIIRIILNVQQRFLEAGNLVLYISKAPFIPNFKIILSVLQFGYQCIAPIPRMLNYTSNFRMNNLHRFKSEGSWYINSR